MIISDKMRFANISPMNYNIKELSKVRKDHCMRLIVNNVSKSYGKHKVLNEATYEFEQGKVYGILGHKGSGKSTLIDVITGEENSDTGSVMLLNDEGINIYNYNQIGVTYNVPALPDFLTGNELIKFFLEANKDKVSPDLTLDDCFEFVHLGFSQRYRIIADCSEAVKYKLQLMCVILTNPSVIVLDEPTILYDNEFMRDLREILKNLTENHIIIIATNVLQSIRTVCDDIVVLNNGELNEITHEQLKNEEFLEAVEAMLREGDNV